ncbi:MAG: anti-sigma factor, partial [Myxococcota bacterium]
MSESETACATVAEDLSALLDGELAEEREVAVRAHLESCPDCMGRVAALRRVDPALAAAPAPEVPADLRARVDARLSSEKRSPRESAAVGRRKADSAAGGRRQADSVAGRRRRARWFSHPAMGFAAAAALALYVGVRAVQPLDGPAGPIGVDESEPQIAGTLPESMTSSSQPEIRALDPLAPLPGSTSGSEWAPVAEVDLDDVSDEELAMALEFDTIEDLEVIANLDLLVRLLEVEEA